MPQVDLPVVTRMAPSPTGLFHVGSLRTSIFNYLFAKQHEGTFILRIEDTDESRSKKEYEKNILDSFEWLNLSYDALYRQSERTDIYQRYLDELIAAGAAYEAEENTTGKGKVIRFRNPNTTISFLDTVLGEITVDTSDLGDFVIARDREHPLYHLSVIVDDGEMNVTHVIRGQDHISNTPRQILLLEACGFVRPTYAHVPLILAADKSKLSKRHGAVAVTAYRDQGYLPEALINFLALLGWNPGTEQEIFSRDELIEQFDLHQIQKGGAVFNQEKLDWVNKQWLQKLSPEEFASYLHDVAKPLHSQDKAMYEKLLPLIRERIEKKQDFISLLSTGEFTFFFENPTHAPDVLVWKTATAEETKTYLQNLIEQLQVIDSAQWNKDTVKDVIWPYAEEAGKGNVLWPMRYALSGREKSPDPFTIAGLLGKEVTIQRLQYARKTLS